MAFRPSVKAGAPGAPGAPPVFMNPAQFGSLAAPPGPPPGAAPPPGTAPPTAATEASEAAPVAAQPQMMGYNYNAPAEQGYQEQPGQFQHQQQQQPPQPYQDLQWNNNYVMQGAYAGYQYYNNGEQHYYDQEQYREPSISTDYGGEAYGQPVYAQQQQQQAREPSVPPYLPPQQQPEVYDQQFSNHQVDDASSPSGPPDLVAPTKQGFPEEQNHWPSEEAEPLAAAAAPLAHVEVPEAAQVGPQPPGAAALTNGAYGSGPDVTAVSGSSSNGSNFIQKEEEEVEEAAVAAPPQQGSHAEHYAYYQQFEQPQPEVESTKPPDILSAEPLISPNSDRNLFMQTGELKEGEREPVDGGNDQEEDVQTAQNDADVDLPLDRLVLGESEQQSLPAIPPPPVSGSSAMVNPPPALLPPPPPPGGGRIVAGSSLNADSDRVVPGNGSYANPAPVTVQDPPEARSGAVGSDRRDQSVMGPPPPAGPSPPSGRRNVTGSADASTAPKRGNRRGKRESDYSDDERPRRRYDEGSSSRDSSRKRRRNRRRHEKSRRSPSESDDESPEDPKDSRRRYKDSRRRHDDYDGDRYRRQHYRRRHHHHHDRSYVDDGYLNDSRRGYSRHEREGSVYDQDSRPSSRAGDGYRYESYHHPYPRYPPHPMFHMQAPQPPVPQPPSLDQEKLQVFKKNWEYYSRNPREMENLRLKNPQKHETLMKYYQMYSHLLPKPASSAVMTESERPSRCGSVHSAQSSVAGATTTSANVSLMNNDQTALSSTATEFQTDFHAIKDESTIYPDPSAADPYQPTLEATQFGHSPVPDAEGEAPPNGHQAAYDPLQRLTPVKFNCPHVKASLSARGVVVKVDAKSPLNGQTATVELHALQAVLGAQPGAEELRAFPGPLVPGRTHKGEVIQFCQSKIQDPTRLATLIDKDAYVLIWELLILLLRQKNTIDGSDIAELLLKDRQDVHRPYVNSDAADGTKNGLDRSVIVAATAAEEQEKHAAKFRDYLLFGHKKEGLEYAMRHGLWGHALFLASKMDERSYSTVMLRFANGLAVNDPLQTLYQSMSGRQPIAVKECADANWGDWRPHLAMILSNPSGKAGLDARAIVTLGDTLTEKGYIYAGQFCYLMANLEFGTYGNGSAKLVLILGDRGAASFGAFATNEAIQASEVLEYAQKLSNADHVSPTLQYFKYLYAVRLMDHGMASDALYYLEEIAGCIVKRPQDFVGDIGMDGCTMANQVLALSDQLKFLDPMYTTRDGEIADMGDPEWLQKLQHAVYQINTNAYSYSSYEQQEQTTYDYPSMQDYSAEPEAAGDQQHPPEQPLYAPPEPPVEPQPVYVSEPVETEAPPQVPMFVPQEQPAMAAPMMPPIPEMAPVPSMPVKPEPRRPSLHPEPPKPSEPKPNLYNSIASQKAAETDKKPAENNVKKTAKKAEPPKKSEPGIFGKFFGGLFKPPNQVHLPDDKDNAIVWDEEKKRWVDKNADPAEEAAALAPPPSMKDLAPKVPVPGAAAAPPPPGGNMYKAGLGKRKGLGGRVDVFKNSQSAPSLPPSAPSNDLGPMLAPPGPLPMDSNAAPPNMMVPSAAPDQEQLQQQQEETVPEPAASGAPVFFNPNQMPARVAPAATRRNKYA